MLPLAELEVLAVDCQATAASPRGHLLELGWARVGPAGASTHTCLIRLPPGARIPPAVARISGISRRAVHDGIDAHAAWRELSAEAAKLGAPPAPAVVHFARFEEPFLCSLAGGALPLDLVCTHEIARRLLPDLPRCSLRAVTGYFGRAVGSLRRSAEHVEATAFVWRELVRLLREEGVETWDGLHAWLGARSASTRRRRVWPMPRELRLSVPGAPGVYRLLRTSGDILYVGKALSLHHRVNSYFRKQHGVPERTLEMLSQARGVSFEITETALEAALLEADEIKRHAPPYNIALTSEDRRVWFAPPDLSGRSAHPSPRCHVGPFPSAEVLDRFTAFAQGSPEALGAGSRAPGVAAFEAGYARLRAAHGELTCGDVGAHSRLLRLGTRLWREGRRDCEALSDDWTLVDGPGQAWTPELVQFSLERLVLRAALARRRARWLTRMIDAAVVWTEPGADRARLIVLENGDVTVRDTVRGDSVPPVPPGHSRSVAARHEALTIARFDRVRVLTTELKRLVAEGAPVALRFGATPPLGGARLAYALSWV